MPEIPYIGEIKAIQIQRIHQQILNALQRAIEQEESQCNFEEWCEEAQLPGMKTRFKPIKNLKEAAKEKSETKSMLKKVEKKEETASKFQKNNYELSKKDLLLLRDSISEKDSVEDILEKVLSFYSDYFLADEALDFLILTTTLDLKEKVIKAKERLNEKYEREIKAGRNIKIESQEYSKLGLGTPIYLRNIYRDITGTARTTLVLFFELSKVFDYEKLKSVCKFLLHALGADLKSKGPSIPRVELIKWIGDIKSLQAILGLYLFFKSKDPLIISLFEKNHLDIPKNLNFETLAKQFINLVTLRYVSGESIISIARNLGISHEILAQIIIFSQMRDATRHTSMKLYKSSKHRQELLEELNELLEELEEKLEEEEE